MKNPLLDAAILLDKLIPGRPSMYCEDCYNRKSRCTCKNRVVKRDRNGNEIMEHMTHTEGPKLGFDDKCPVECNKPCHAEFTRPAVRLAKRRAEKPIKKDSKP